MQTKIISFNKLVIVLLLVITSSIIFPAREATENM